MSSGPSLDNELMYGWLVCRFDRKQIHSILYGQFSKQPLPPSTGWVFLAKDAAEASRESDVVKLSREGLDGKALSLFAKGIDRDDVIACCNSVTGSSTDGISVTAEFLQNDKDPTAPTTRYYVIRNCPIPAVNGRYMDGGFSEGAPVYRNVREWALVRTKMEEIPELGINAKGSYAIQEGSSISETYHEAAALAFEELLQDDPTGAIRDGSYQFKKRFSALSRAGNRMITADQSEQLYFVDQKRAALRSKLSASLLQSLQEVRESNAAAGVTTSEASPAPSAASTSRLTSSTPAPGTVIGSLTSQAPQTNLSRSQVLPYMNETLESCAPDTIKSAAARARPVTVQEGAEGLEEEEEEGGRESIQSGSQATRSSANRKGTMKPQKKAPGDAASVASSRMGEESVGDEVGVEIDITLGRSISYQHGSQGFVLHRLGGDGDDVFLDAEAELAREVTICIEDREAAVSALRMEAALLKRAYLTHSEAADVSEFNHSVFEGSYTPALSSAPGSPASRQHTARSSHFASSHNSSLRDDTEYYLNKVESLLAKMREVRRLTIAFADAFGAWVRLMHKQKQAKWRRDKKKAEQFGASYKKMNRTYAVLIAYRSAQELYPLSEAVQSNVKKFSRPMEPVKYATETKLVGVYETKDEAIAAFDKAFNEIPQEYVLLSDLQAVNKRLMGLRRCGQHYWVRSSGVPQNMECEQCNLQRQLDAERDKGVPEVYQEEPVAQYIWNGQNYLEKMWSDLDFLAEVEFLKKALPEENFLSNPLLLGNTSVSTLLSVLHSTNAGNKKAATMAASRLTAPSSGDSERRKHVLADLRGNKELLKDAGKAGERHNALVKQQQYDALYKDSPYNHTANFGSLKRKSDFVPVGSTVTGDGGSYFDGVASALPPGDTEYFVPKSGGDVPNSPYPAGSSVFYETTVGSLGSEFGQTVAVREVVNLPDGSTLLGENSIDFATGNHSRSHLDSPANASLLTAPTMRASRSAASHLFPESSLQGGRTGTVAGNGAMGVKGIKSASEKTKKRPKPMADATVLDKTDLAKSRTGTRGLNTNTYLPEDLRQTARLPPVSKGTTSTTMAAANASVAPQQKIPARPAHSMAQSTATTWDSDFLTDAAATTDRLARALQLIGQCPAPANDIHADKFGLTNAQLGTTSGPDAFSSTMNGTQSQKFPLTSTLGLGNSLNSSSPQNISAVASPSKRQQGRQEKKMTQVETFYAYRGAQMSLLQERRAVAHRTEETFCRSDVGEWAGFKKGRAMRAFEFQENLYVSGKKKEEERKNLQQLIRNAIAVDIIVCDVPYVTALIERAQKMRGSMLDLDIAQAELFLRRYAAVCQLCLRGQAWFRGGRDRKRVKEMRRLIREAKRHYRTTEIEAAKMAITWVANLLTKCVKTRVQKEKRSVFRFTMNMSGVFCMISMRRQALPSRKPTSITALCAGCQTQCIIDKFEPADRSVSHKRAPCTCTFRAPLEQWQLNIYNPLTRQTFNHVMDVAQVRQMLRGIEWAARIMRTSAFAQQSLCGDSFDHLTPLFSKHDPLQQEPGSGGVEDDAFSGRRMDRSFSKALLSAAEESSVLPRMPLLLPPEISCVINEAGLHEYQTSEYFRTPFLGSRPVVGFNRTRIMDGRRDVSEDAYLGGADPLWAWHPLVDMTKLKVEVGRHRVLSEQFASAVHSAAAHEEACLQARTALLARLECVQIVYEDSRAVLLRAVDSIQAAQDKIEQVMRYCKKLQTDLDLEERGQQLDDRQSYENLEDANMWIGLNEKRRLEKVYSVQYADFAANFKAYIAASDQFARASEVLRYAQQQHQSLSKRFEAHLPQISLRQQMLRDLQTQTRAAAAAVLSTFSLPRKHPSYAMQKTRSASIGGSDIAEEGVMPVVKYSSSRRLQRIPWNLIFVREPLERLRLQNRGAMAVLQRRIMKLRPQQGTLDKRIKGYLRCVVLVLLDETTGNLVLHIGQDEASVEESNQHKDLFLQKSDFSDLTSHGLDNDIILKPEDVDWILSVPVELSAANLSRANKYAKGKVHGYHLDPNRVVLDQPNRDPLVLPSQALRSLSGVSAYPSATTKLSGLQPTFQQRRDVKEQRQIAQAGELLRYLRLQAHTGRPCVGLLHFRRRLAFSHKHIMQSSWLSDLVNVDPLLLINHLNSRVHMWNDSIVMVHAYNTLRRFQLEVQLPFPTHASTISTEVPTSHVISSLQAQPLLLANFLWELVTNSFTPQTISRVVEGVDWQLPGQLDSSYWRRSFPDEISRPHFQHHESMKYRGPVYQRHRFVSSRYFMAKLYLSAQQDILVVLSPPTDGKFHHHEYRGPPLQVHVSRSELYVIVAKVSVQAALVPAEMLGTLLLLHPQNMHVLFSLLLELLHLSLTHHHEHHGHHHLHHVHEAVDEKKVQHGKFGRSRPRKGRRGARAVPTKRPQAAVAGRVVLPALSEDASQSFDVAVNLSVLFKRTSLLFDKYDHWVVGRHSAFLETLSEDARTLMRRSFARYAASRNKVASGDQLVPYTVLTQKDPSNKQQMRVYHSVWSFLDISTYYGDPLQPIAQARALQLMGSKKGATFWQLKQLREGSRRPGKKQRRNSVSSVLTMSNKPTATGHTFPTYTLGDDCFDSLMAVEVLTNISKTTLLVDISPIDLSHADAQSIVSGYEQSLFAQEDRRAAELRRFSKVKAAKRAIMSERTRVQLDLQERLLPEQETLARRQSLVFSCASTMQKQFLTAYDEDQERRAQFVLNAALSALFGLEEDSRLAHIHKSPVARSLGTVIRVPPHQMRNPLVTEAAAWMNETLRHLRKVNTSLSSTSVSFTCVDAQGNHYPVLAATGDTAKERYNSFPSFTSQTLPRHEARLRDSAGSNALDQPGAGFRDPDRWYHAKRLNRTNYGGKSGLDSYRAFLQMQSPVSKEEAGQQEAHWPVGKPAAFTGGALHGKRLVSAAVLDTLLHPRSNEEKREAPSDVVASSGDKYFLVKESFIYTSGVASIDLYCLKTNKIVHIYAHCQSQAVEPTGDLLLSVSSLVHERGQVYSSSHSRVQSILDAEQMKLLRVTDEIDRALATLSLLDAELSGVTDPRADPAWTLEVLGKYANHPGGELTSAHCGPTFSYHQSDAQSLSTTASPKMTKSSKRRHKARSSSADWDADAGAQSEAFVVPIVGFYVPRDEALAPKLIRTTAPLWSTVVAENMGPHDLSFGSTQVLSISRRISPFGLIYFNSNAHTHLNGRVHRLFVIMQSQTEQLGGGSLAASTSDDSAARPSAVYGDALILLRHGTKDMNTIRLALQAMQEEYAPMKALRALKEGKERQWRLTNHAAFRQIVFGMAYPVLNSTEDMYGVLKPSVRSLLDDSDKNPFPAPLPLMSELPIFQLRLLQSKFNDLLRCLHAVRAHCADSENASSWRHLEYFGLLDYCAVCDDEPVLLHFDEKCPTNVDFGEFNRRDPYLKEMLTPVPISSVLRDVLATKEELENDERGKYYLSDHDDKQIIITVGQVMYAVYQLHVHNCQLPIPLCRFPGCGRIRAEAAAATTELSDPPIAPSGAPYLGTMVIHDGDDLSTIPGSGVHPVDKAIKEYFFSQKDIFTKQPPLYLPGHRAPHASVESVNGKVVVNDEDSDDDEAGDEVAAARARDALEDVSVEDEILEERALDQAVVATRDTNVLLQLEWRDLKEEAALMYTLHNALVRPEVAGSVTGRELLMAKGGIYALAEEAAVKKLVTKALVTQTGAANADYSEYDVQADAKELLRLVPSAAQLAEAAAAQEAEEAEAREAEHGIYDNEDGSLADSRSDVMSSRSGSSTSGSGSGSDEEEGEDSEGSEGLSSSDDPDEDAFSASSEGTQVARTEKLNVQAQVHLKQTHAIPIDILRALSSAALQTFSVKTGFDPYPVHVHAHSHGSPHHAHHRHHEQHEHVNAMPPHMYQMLMQRLRLTRPDKIPNLLSSGDGAALLTMTAASATAVTRRGSEAVAAPQYQHPTHYFRFDRLHHEQVVILQDGSIVIMQFMYGILAGASLVVVQPKAKKKNPKLFQNNDNFPNIEIYEAVSGSPPAAIRFLHTSKLPTLRPGLTIAVFDALSSVSRAFIVEERSMQRTCEAFGVQGGDFTALSRKIASHAHQCVQLTRAGLYCTTVMFSLASLIDEHTDLADSRSEEEVGAEEHDMQQLRDEEPNVLVVEDAVSDEEEEVMDESTAGALQTDSPSEKYDIALRPSVHAENIVQLPRYVQSHLGVLGRLSALKSLLADE